LKIKEPESGKNDLPEAMGFQAKSQETAGRCYLAPNCGFQEESLKSL
jgi:hypothetical protein